MIYLYTGTPGSGKSLHVAEQMRIQIKYRKAPCIANFEFNAEACRPRGYGSFFYVDNQSLNPEFLYRFSEEYKKKKKVRRLEEDEILLVIDECQLLFNSRTWQGSQRMAWIGFFSQHRKMGYCVILIAQFDEMVDKQMRALVEYECMHRRIKNIGFFGRFFDFLAMGQLHVCNTYHIASGIKTDHYFFKGSEKLYILYDSYTRFDERVDSPDMRSVSGEDALVKS